MAPLVAAIEYVLRTFQNWFVEIKEMPANGLLFDVVDVLAPPLA